MKGIISHWTSIFKIREGHINFVHLTLDPTLGKELASYPHTNTDPHLRSVVWCLLFMVVRC